MKWFPHDCDAYEHPKLKKLRKNFGHTGEIVYWNTLSIIGRYGGKSLKLSLKKYELRQISDDFGTEVDTLLKVWEEMMDMGSLSRPLFKKGFLYSSKLKERPDEYTKKVWRESRQGTDSVRTMSANNTVQHSTIHNNTIHAKDAFNKYLNDKRLIGKEFPK